MHGTSTSGKTFSMDFNIADISRPTASMGEILGKANRAVFDSDDSYIENKQTGAWMPMRREGNLFYLDVWCQVPTHIASNPFVRQVGAH